MTDRVAQLAQLTAAHEAAYAGLLGATEGLDADAWSRPTGCPGWDVRAQLSHVVGVERMLLGDPPPEVEVPDGAHLRDEMGRFIERDVVVRRDVPAEDLRAEASEVFDRRRAVLAETTPDQLDLEANSLFGTMRLASVLRMRLFDMTSHERDVRAAVDRLDGFAGPHLDVATEQVLRSWARTAPARVDRSGTLRIEVRGGPTVALDLATGTVLRDGQLPADHDASLTLSVADVLALGGGRNDAPAAGDLVTDGDTGLVTTFVAVAGITP